MNKLVLLKVLFVIIYFTEEGIHGEETKIVNGTNAGEEEFPFMVSLRNRTYHFCGGTIIRSNYILTAAHCLCDNAIPRSLDGVKVHYGSNRLNNGEEIAVVETKCHQEYDINNYLQNDVAVLKLHWHIPEIFTPVRIASHDMIPYLESKATVIGWGYDKTNGQISELLQKVELVVYSYDVCKNSVFGREMNLKFHLCCGVYGNGKGSCQGDSGGPLLIKNNVQVGIVSFGIGGNCGISNSTYPKMMTRVVNYADWIHQHAFNKTTINTISILTVSILLIILSFL